MEVCETARLALEPDAAWQQIGDFGAVGDWHPMLRKVDSDGNKRGALRHVTASDGSRQVERLEVWAPARHAYRYTLVETTLPVRDYTAEFRIDQTEGGSLVVWSAHFDADSADPHKGEAAVRQFLRAGTEALAQRFG